LITHDDTVATAEPPTLPLTYGTTSYFSRMTGADRDIAAYWTSTVDRAAHRNVHPRLSVEGCPGCVFERAVA
jgi:hypothetical protein